MGVCCVSSCSVCRGCRLCHPVPVTPCFTSKASRCSQWLLHRHNTYNNTHRTTQYSTLFSRSVSINNPFLSKCFTSTASRFSECLFHSRNISIHTHTHIVSHSQLPYLLPSTIKTTSCLKEAGAPNCFFTVTQIQ